MELLKHLQKREADNNPIRVGIVGCGQMGSGMVHVTHRTPGMRIVAIADIDPDQPTSTLKALKVPGSAIRITGKRSEAEDAIQAGKYVVTDDAAALAQADMGARHHVRALSQGLNVGLQVAEKGPGVAPALDLSRRQTVSIRWVSNDSHGVDPHTVRV